MICEMCNGRGEIGGPTFSNPPEYDSEPCPDCNKDDDDQAHEETEGIDTTSQSTQA